MSLASYLKNKQPVVSKSFSYALTHDQLAHAYLLSGEPGIPLKEAALFLAKSLLCDHPTPFADESCITCQRIDHGEYPDFVFLNGEEESIKKDEVRDTVTFFQSTPLERKGIMIYVIHLVENMTPEAVNSLLKFLEEPNDYTYAFLTTQNEERVLPTIISRCEKLRMTLSPREDVQKEAIALGVEEADAALLSYFHNDASLLKAASEEENYHQLRDTATEFIDLLSHNHRFARFYAEKDVALLCSTKANARFFFDILTVFFRDIVSAKGQGPIVLGSYDNIIAEAAKNLPHVEQSLLTLMTLRGEIELNIRVSLILSHLVSALTQE